MMPPPSWLLTLLHFVAYLHELTDAGHPCGHGARAKDCPAYDDSVTLVQTARQVAARSAPSRLFHANKAQVMTNFTGSASVNFSDSASANFSGNATPTAESQKVCVWPRDLDDTVQHTMSKVLEGLPPWPAEHDLVPASVSHVALAFLIQVTWKERLLMLRRVFNHLYSPYDVYLYMVDESTLDVPTVLAALPNDLPPNVVVVSSPHAGYYYWPRVQVLLNGMKYLLSLQWDFVVHLSESDYPLHSLDWIRDTLAAQRRHIFLKIHPRCQLVNRTLVSSQWYWWSQSGAVASCEGAFPPRQVQSVRFPIEEMEQQGFVFGSASEWNILPRELVEYAMLPDLLHFKRMVGMHVAADEIFWATLVLNIPEFSRTINPQSWFMYRSAANTGHSPDTLVQSHMTTILEARRTNFFLRKVDLGHSQALLDVLDQVILQQHDALPGPGRLPWDSREHAISCAWEPSRNVSGPYPYWTPPPEPRVTGPFPAPAPPPESWLP
uniref:protein xylosyltransferase n=1 Tax=Alexandrium catenella TaxID=2925 RepID=A0A7S1PK25_ALECA|mmetsp:Transcript_101703/g.270544  ORF Transcript_101703/g.270544 Transcript_101703/m.270544 type:complete len:494 (+) Transcript_101703:93-1574(+)